MVLAWRKARLPAISTLVSTERMSAMPASVIATRMISETNRTTSVLRAPHAGLQIMLRNGMMVSNTRYL